MYQFLLLAVSCDQGMEFKEKTSACHATCEKPDAPEKCSFPDTENCVCPDNKVLINGTCHLPEKCKCPGGYEVCAALVNNLFFILIHVISIHIM